MGARSLSLKDGVYAVAILVGLVIALCLGIATYVGYHWYTERYSVSTDADGVAKARVVTAAFYGRSDLRVAQLSGVVQGTARASRFWGWLNSSQVIKAPYEVDYFVNLGGLRARDIRMSKDNRLLTIDAPEVFEGRPNIDLARTTYNTIDGLIVTRGATMEMNRKVSASAQQVALEKAQSKEQRDKAREHARAAIARLFEGALDAAGLDARVEVRFPNERGGSSEQWDVSRSIAEVLANAR